MKNRYDIEAVAKYLVDDKFVSTSIRKKCGSQSIELILQLQSGEFPDCDGEDLLNYLIDLLHNNARLYKRYIARGSCGNYYIDIQGLGGVYFYHAPEFDRKGYFLSIEDAGSDIELDWNDNLTSYNGRIYRKPFVSTARVEAVKKSKADESLRKAQLFLSTNATAHDVTAWKELLISAPLRDVETCVHILELWFKENHDLSALSDISHEILFRFTLESCKEVFSHLKDRGQGSLVRQIELAANHDFEVYKKKLDGTYGVARIGAAQSLGSAKNRSDSIKFALQEIGLGLDSVGSTKL